MRTRDDRFRGGAAVAGKELRFFTEPHHPKNSLQVIETVIINRHLPALAAVLKRHMSGEMLLQPILEMLKSRGEGRGST